jgi:hypothetical protein
MNAADFLKAKAKPTETKAKKSETPILDLPNTLRDSLDMIVKQKAIEKNAESLRKQAEEILRPVCAKMREQLCVDQHKFHASVKVKCEDIGPVTFVTQQKYSKIPSDKDEEIKKETGNDYDKYFKLETTITLTEKGMQLIDELLPKLAKVADEVCKEKDSWSKIFSVEQHIVPTEEFHQDRVLDPKTAGVATKLIDAGLIKPQTPSFTV